MPSEERFKKLDVWAWVVMALLAFNGWTAMTLISTQTRIAVIEDSRFTAQDGTKLFTQIEAISQRIPNRIPPEWFEREVRDVERRLETVERALYQDIAEIRALLNATADVQEKLIEIEKRLGKLESEHEKDRKTLEDDNLERKLI